MLHQVISNIPFIKKKFQGSPLGLKIYIVLSCLMVVLSVLYVFSPETIIESVVPVTGGAFFAPYLWGVGLPFFWVLARPKKSSLDGIRKIIILFLFFESAKCVIDGIIMMGDGVGNPYLMFSPYRWIIRCFIPIACIFYFRSKNMIEYFANAN